jgi:hypothetical protein
MGKLSCFLLILVFPLFVNAGSGGNLKQSVVIQQINCITV